MFWKISVTDIVIFERNGLKYLWTCKLMLLCTVWWWYLLINSTLKHNLSTASLKYPYAWKIICSQIHCWWAFWCGCSKYIRNMNLMVVLQTQGCVIMSIYISLWIIQSLQWYSILNMVTYNFLSVIKTVFSCSWEWWSYKLFILLRFCVLRQSCKCTGSNPSYERVPDWHQEAQSTAQAFQGGI